MTITKTKNLIKSLSVCLWALTAQGEETQGIRLQGLDKVTGRVFNIQAKINSSIRFGSLVICPRACFKAPPEEQPESTAFLEIYEEKDGPDKEKLFSSWMFASSPSINGLDHPVYDVWVVECTTPEERNG